MHELIDTPISQYTDAVVDVIAADLRAAADLVAEHPEVGVDFAVSMIGKSSVEVREAIGRWLETHKYSSTQIDLPEPLRSDVLLFPINPEDIVERELNPHITVRYGLTDATASDVARVLAGVGPVRVVLGAVSVFEAVPTVAQGRWASFGTDRYQVLGIPYPNPKTVCQGQCEGTGWVPVYLGVGDTQEPYVEDGTNDETDSELVSAWHDAEDEHPTDDGWHFVRCPACHGTGLRGLLRRMLSVGNGLTEDIIRLRVAEVQAGHLATKSVGQASVARNASDVESDVLKIDVHSDDLHRLNSLLASLPHEDTHPTYHPHVTLAYLKPGRGSYYAGISIFVGREFTVDSLVFCDRNEEQTTISLNNFKDLKIIGKNSAQSMPGIVEELNGDVIVPRAAKSNRRSETLVHKAADKHAPAIKTLFAQAFAAGARRINRAAIARTSSPTVVQKLLEPAIQATAAILQGELEKRLLACLADGGEAGLSLLGIRAAEDAGHEFHGNQWTSADLSSLPRLGSGKLISVAKILGKPIADIDFPEGRSTPSKATDVKIANLTPLQHHVNEEGLRRHLDSNDHSPIDVIRHEGKLYIDNGHHHVIAAVLRGEKTIPVVISNTRSARSAEWSEDNHSRDDHGRFGASTHPSEPLAKNGYLTNPLTQSGGPSSSPAWTGAKDKIEGALTGHSFGEMVTRGTQETVPIDSLSSYQTWTRKDSLEHHAADTSWVDKPAAIIYHHEGKDWIVDGNNRLSVLKSRGETHAKVLRIAKVTHQRSASEFVSMGDHLFSRLPEEWFSEPL